MGVAAKRKTVRKGSRKKTIKRKSAPKKKPTKSTSGKSKKTARKSDPKKKISKKKTATKKKKVVKKSKKKSPAKKKTTTKAKKKFVSKVATKKTESTINMEKERINLLLKEINLLEKDNHKLTQQISKAQTKQEVVQELKSYLALLKQTPQEKKRGLPTLGETKEENYDQKMQERDQELAQQEESAKNKDKLISRLKSLLAMSRKDPEPEYAQEPVQADLSEQEEIRQTALKTIQAADEEGVHIDIESSRKTQVQPQAQVTQPTQEQTQEEQPSQEEEDEHEDEEQQEPKEQEESQKQKKQLDVEELVRQRLAQIEQKEEAKKGEYQADIKRGIITQEEAQEYSELLKKMVTEINKVFIGQKDAVEGVLLSVICDAHTLLEGVPGLAKTLLIETLGKIIDGTTFKRIQFLPDLLPSDIIGGQVFNPKTAEYKIYKGPIFANFVLCDEINRAPPKTHAAVMEAMQEKKINIENEEFKLDRPFFVLATQNPLENKGTYDLPEAVLDRFMFKVILDYPERKYELAIITENATTKNLKKNLKPVIDKKKLLEIQKQVKKAYISDKIREYILDIVEATRGDNKDIEGYKFVKYGAGVRASIYLSLAAKARAVMEGRTYVLPEDVNYVAYNTLRHRVVMNYRGKAHNISSEKIIDEILTKVKAL